MLSCRGQAEDDRGGGKHWRSVVHLTFSVKTPDDKRLGGVIRLDLKVVKQIAYNYESI